MKKDNGQVPENKDLHDLIRQKEASIQAKGRLIDNMAYQIRTLSNAVIGFSDLLLSEKLTDELMEYVKEINQAGNGLSSLVNEVLDWARLESGRLRVSHTPCDLSNIIRNLERIVSSSAAEKELDYEIEVDPDLPSQILSDEDRLSKCLVNLTANAFKYTRQGVVRVRVLSEDRDRKPYVRIEITDSGIGMTPEQIDQIFEPALRAEDINNEVLTMLDMRFTVTAGLPLTKQLIELLGGTLTVTSEPNVGSTFSLVLPTGLEVDSIGKLGSYPPTSQTEQVPSDSPQQLPCVLLVEDQQSNRKVISLMLESLGVSVETAEDGQEGVKKASEKKYDLILMDLKMPRMDGYQASQKLRENQSQTPVVALSAKVLSDRENQQINAMFDGFLTKPVDCHKLSEAIEKFISNVQITSLPQEETSDQKAEKIDAEEIITFEYGN
ncbi:MAG: response regulator [Phycisphaerae bacterium]|nr:response regulator [Phycisphaerae bacterium]